MIRRNQAFLNRLNMLLDMLLVVLAYVISSWVRLHVLNGREDNMAAVSGQNILLSAVYAFVVFFLMGTFGFYSTTRTRSMVWKVRTIFFAVSLAVLLASTTLFLFKLIDFSRGVLLLFYILTLLFLTGKYAVMRFLFNQMRIKGYNLKHVLVIGTGNLAVQYALDTANERGLGIRIDGFAGPETGEVSPYLGDYPMLDQLLSNPSIQEAVIALEPEEYSRIREMIGACEKNGIKYYVIPFYNDIIPAHPVIETIGSSKLIDMRANRLDSMGWHSVKRLFDILVSTSGLIILSPLLLVLTIGVKLSSPGPVLFRQIRIGYQRKEFLMLKFRSMRVNSQENTAWSTDKDNRRTKFGSLIRKTSLDELPQLWNVLKGDMSLVGPRPELPFYVEQFKESIPLYMVKHQVKPGMTGWDQINGYRGTPASKSALNWTSGTLTTGVSGWT